MKILVKLWSIVIMDALIGGMLTSITNENGLACMRLGALTAAD